MPNKETGVKHVVPTGGDSAATRPIHGPFSETPASEIVRTIKAKARLARALGLHHLESGGAPWRKTSD